MWSSPAASGSPAQVAWTEETATRSCPVKPVCQPLRKRPPIRQSTRGGVVRRLTRQPRTRALHSRSHALAGTPVPAARLPRAQAGERLSQVWNGGSGQSQGLDDSAVPIPGSTRREHPQACRGSLAGLITGLITPVSTTYPYCPRRVEIAVATLPFPAAKRQRSQSDDLLGAAAAWQELLLEQTLFHSFSRSSLSTALFFSPKTSASDSPANLLFSSLSCALWLCCLCHLGLWPRRWADIRLAE